MAIAFTALLSAGYTFGWQMLYPLISGALIGLLAILRLLKHERVSQDQKKIERGEQQEGASYLVTFRHNGPLAFFVLFLGFYSAMLATELSVLRVFLEFLLRIPFPELFTLVLMVALVCYSYVFIGGFRAVLITDYFQLIVVIIFLGLFLANIDLGSIKNLPSATAAKIRWTPWREFFLYIGVFCGAFSWTFASIDQWYRTAGTLPRKAARTVLIQSVLILCSVTVVPVMIGSHALAMKGIPPSITNEISLVLVQEMLRDASTTVRFAFLMALVCAALTTLNTYIMTIQQLYYELSIRINAKTHRGYILEYITKWKQIRTVGLVFMAACFLASFSIPDHAVYSFGVFALCGYVFSVPLLLSKALDISEKSQILRKIPERATSGLMISIILFMPILILVRQEVGPISLHLYAIPAAAGIATLIGNATLVLLPSRRRIFNGQ
jgi:Na+/pantothenate symporter